MLYEIVVGSASSLTLVVGIVIAALLTRVRATPHRLWWAAALALGNFLLHVTGIVGAHPAYPDLLFVDFFLGLFLGLVVLPYFD